MEQQSVEVGGKIVVIAGWFVGTVLLLTAIELTLKGMALWRAAQLRQKGWFIAMLLLNTIGILPAIYLLTHKHKTEQL